MRILILRENTSPIIVTNRDVDEEYDTEYVLAKVSDGVIGTEEPVLAVISTREDMQYFMDKKFDAIYEGTKKYYSNELADKIIDNIIRISYPNKADNIYMIPRLSDGIVIVFTTSEPQESLYYICANAYARIIYKDIYDATCEMKDGIISTVFTKGNPLIDGMVDKALKDMLSHDYNLATQLSEFILNME
jgi:hypothetical protein